LDKNYGRGKAHLNTSRHDILSSIFVIRSYLPSVYPLTMQDTFNMNVDSLPPTKLLFLTNRKIEQPLLGTIIGSCVLVYALGVLQ